MIADEVMAGLPRAMVHVAKLERAARPDRVRQGRQLGLRPTWRRRHLRRDRSLFDERVYPGGLTYSGHPLACAAPVASIGIFEEEGVLEQARHLGNDIIGPALHDMQSRHSSIGEVRGLGVFWAVELVQGRRYP